MLVRRLVYTPASFVDGTRLIIVNMASLGAVKEILSCTL